MIGTENAPTALWYPPAKNGTHPAWMQNFRQRHLREWESDAIS